MEPKVSLRSEWSDLKLFFIMILGPLVTKEKLEGQQHIPKQKNNPEKRVVLKEDDILLIRESLLGFVACQGRPRKLQRITINISGEIYETMDRTLTRFPDTLLGKLDFEAIRDIRGSTF